MPNYYNVSVHTSTEEAGDSVATQTLPNSTVLNITPHMGYVVDASNFYIGDPLPPEIDSVSFSDSTTPGTSGNIVYATVTLNPQFSMPSSNTTINIDIDGVATQIISSPLPVVLVANTPIDGSCPSSEWPFNQAENRNGFNRCSGHFWDTQVDSNTIHLENFIDPNWTDPTHIATDGSSREVFTTTMNSNSTELIFSKRLWASVGYHYDVVPYIHINPNSLGNYTVVETPDSLVLNASVSTVSNNQINLNTVSGIIPGMIVSFSGGNGNLFSLANVQPGQQGEWPGIGMDIRVIQVDAVNNTVYLSENQPLLISGDTLEFSTQTDQGNIVAKEFTISFDTTVAVPIDSSVIHFISKTVPTPLSEIHGNTSGSNPTPVINNVTI